MNTEVKTKAKDFAIALRSSPPITAYVRAQKKMATDEKTQGLISEFQKKQNELWLIKQNRYLTSEEILSFRKLQEKIIRSPIVREFSLTQAEAFDLCRSVAQSLSELLGVDFASLVSPPSSC